VTLGITADHGMNAKQQRESAAPNVVYLETLLTERFGGQVRVILPITDPYVVHHGALGSFAVVHLPPHVDARAAEVFIEEISGITEVHPRRRAARLLELPEDRIGDLIVLSARDVVIGKTPDSHDLSVLTRADHPDAPASGLRSHGGRYEEVVPMIINRPLNRAYAHLSSLDPRNFDVFDFCINGTIA
jgi:phosphonoacetate hydrolase